MTAEQDTLRRLQDAGFILQKALAPVVEKHMQARFGKGWIIYASRARGANEKAPLDLYGLLKTIISNWGEVFSPHLPANARNAAYAALEGRNAVAHPGEPIEHDAAIHYLYAHHELLKAVKSPQAVDVHKLWEAEVKA
ncbi:MAG: Swt1 family HEPN domain-containing protein, partial [Candidatus Saccharimonadales bacterium]